jgi:transcriptional regulator with GAF, ATPase, and Fis domain
MIDKTVNILGSSKKIKDVLDAIKTVIEYDIPVFIYGETGTGKELVVEWLHHRGPRKFENLCKVNSSCIQDNLLESELFGHERGAFTGATRAHMGKFEFTRKGTLFLDEISCMSMRTQEKLLRVLEDQTFQSVGSSETTHTDARIITASNVDLQEEVSKKNFRADLLYRISVFPITLPPLRDRKEDIQELCDYFIRRFCERIKCKEVEIGNEVMDSLVDYRWPGNIRELKNSLERAVLMANAVANGNGSHILSEHFLFLNDIESQEKSTTSNVTTVLDNGVPFTLGQVESAYLLSVLNDCRGCITSTAKVLKIDRSTIYKKLNDIAET